MNLSTSPPAAVIAGTWHSNSSFSMSIVSRGVWRAVSSVKPRRSENHTTASIVSMSPREMRPARMRAPALWPT